MTSFRTMAVAANSFVGCNERRNDDVKECLAEVADEGSTDFTHACEDSIGLE